MIRRRHAIAVAVIGVVVAAGIWSWPFLRGVWPAFGPAAPTPVTNPGEPAPLTAAKGWTAYLVTDDVPGARDMELDQFGNLWVSQTSEGKVALVYLKDVAVPEVSAPLRGLRGPHGLAFDPENPSLLYYATETAIYRLPTYSDGGPEKIADLPAGGGHTTRSLLFGEDGRLYVSIGSTCNVCREQNPERGSIISMNKDGSDRQIVATGLRNSVFMTIQPNSGAIWATEMGRDHLGDALPPDEVNVILGGRNYGWPICYGNKIHDTDFDKNVYIRDPCADSTPPIIELPAHVAPLGLAFLDDSTLLIAEHGSWNSSVPVGYNVERWRFKNRRWESDDFLTGFLKGSSAIGRPVDILPMPDGSVLVSDDKAGAIWRVVPDR
jgi:glucose/arabinose dehydrogenase